MSAETKNLSLAERIAVARSIEEVSRAKYHDYYSVLAKTRRAIFIISSIILVLATTGIVPVALGAVFAELETTQVKSLLLLLGVANTYFVAVLFLRSARVKLARDVHKVDVEQIIRLLDNTGLEESKVHSSIRDVSKLDFFSNLFYAELPKTLGILSIIVVVGYVILV